MLTHEGRLRVMVADDQVVAARGAVMYLGALDFEVVGTLDDPRRLLRTFDEMRPDVVLLEPTMGPKGAAFAHARGAARAITPRRCPVLDRRSCGTRP